jgi:hypothetical protein
MCDKRFGGMPTLWANHRIRIFQETQEGSILGELLLFSKEPSLSRQARSAFNGAIDNQATPIHVITTDTIKWGKE